MYITLRVLYLYICIYNIYIYTYIYIYTAWCIHRRVYPSSAEGGLRRNGHLLVASKNVALHPCWLGQGRSPVPMLSVVPVVARLSGSPEVRRFTEAETAVGSLPQRQRCQRRLSRRQLVWMTPWSWLVAGLWSWHHGLSHFSHATCRRMSENVGEYSESLAILDVFLPRRIQQFHFVMLQRLKQDRVCTPPSWLHRPAALRTENIVASFCPVSKDHPMERRSSWKL